ncbi:MAG: hypothetical protein ABSF84_09430 [Acidimicrobiales bacterium]|jgi:hypothetical protein
MPDGRAHPLSDPVFVSGLRPIPSGIADEVATWSASDLQGSDPDGLPVAVHLGEVDRPVLLVFLATQCDGCDQFWFGLTARTDPVLADVLPVVVTKGPDAVPAGEVGELTAGLRDLPVVMSDRAWADYRVTGYPFIVLVEPSSRRILAETVGFGWSDVAATVRAGIGR